MSKHLFIIDPIETLNLAFDTSLRLCLALNNLEQETYVTEQNKIFWQSDKKCAAASAQRIAFADQKIDALELKDPLNMGLEEFSSIHMRKDPPFDINYITTTWLLESASKYTRIYNLPAALRGINEKLIIYTFPNDIKKALVSSDPKQLLDFLQNEAGCDGILKPLNLYGGHDILRLNLSDGFHSLEQIQGILEQETQGGKVLRLLQAFDRNVFNGEVRVFCVGGKPLSWCLKRPQPGNFLANLRSGAHIESYLPTPEISERVTRVAAKLHQMGAAFIGFDLIDGYISEINVTSPRLIEPPGENPNYFEQMANWILKEIESEKV